ncbi:MAG: hypothetical protein IJX53_06400 [Clostridia bacterium]|nr:hypothetical protein [Clostridia bacterium]
MFLLNGCASDANFTVSLTWNSGLSSYDSKSGTLIKDCMANDPTNFTTALHLSDAQMDEVRSILGRIDLAEYPTEYDAGAGMAKPPSGVTLTVTANGGTHRVACRHVGDYTSDDPAGQAFLSVCSDLITLITSTPEWQSLPEFETLLQ